jgi:putative endopeptidase
MQKKKIYWGFDVQRIDKSIRPQDDFYRYANGNWMKHAEIPAEEARWGSFTMLRYDTDNQLKKILKDSSAKKLLRSGSGERMVRDLYLSGMNMKLREKLGAKPTEKLREIINSIKDRKSLIITIAELEKSGISLPWHLLIDQDSKNSKKYVLHIFQGGLGMPDKEYYLKNDPEFKRVRNAYQVYILKLFFLLGYRENEAKKKVTTVMDIETRLASLSMSKVDARDAEKTYHKKTYPELKRFAPEIDWGFYFKKVGIPSVPYVIIGQPNFLKGATKLLSSGSIEDWKVYLEWHLINSGASLLSSPFIKVQFDFYGKTLTGSKKMKPLWRRALGAVNAGLGETLGKIYVDKHFPPQAKKKMNELVDDLFIAYARRIKRLDWMSLPTKKHALAKLKMMRRKIGYPKRWKSYSGLRISRNDYFGNMLRASEFEHRRAIKKLSKPIDLDEWHMSPQTVNAYFSPTMNDIVFPAAILQPPFFDFGADDAINYGAIGAIIGHEITHGFDDQGSKFDGHGNMKNWWKKNDRRHFEKKSKSIVRQYDRYTVADNIHVNGKLTLGENTADLGGLVIALDAYKERLKKTGRKKIAGFTPEERFFLGAAQAECELRRDEYNKTAVLTDPHSPPEFRVNGPILNIPEFYSVFKVKKGDKLYLIEKKRARIW